MKRAAWLSILFMACSVTPTMAQVGAQLPGDNPLQQHRERSVGKQTAGEVFFGWVTRVDDGKIITDVPSDLLRDRGVREHDLLRVEILGKSLRARVVTLPLSGDSGAGLPDLDADVIGVMEKGSGLVLFGLHGNLVEWLSLAPGIPITVGARP